MGQQAFEMLWDCRHCGTRKLLGLTHRHCPRCGAPQPASERYFPDEADKVAVRAGHEFVGADVSCRYCGAASSRRATNCAQCGAGLFEGSEVAPRLANASDEVVSSLRPVVSRPPRPSTWRVAVPLALLATVACVVLAFVWRRPESFVVRARSWERRIEVERLSRVEKSAWCDSLPAGAVVTGRQREARGSEQVRDGEECHTVQRDRADGTFVEDRVCQPKYRTEARYADRCRYTATEWSVARSERATGDAERIAPHWPAVTLSNGECASVGCERIGRRSERYDIELEGPRGGRPHCELTEPEWRQAAPGRSYSGSVRRLLGTLDCESLRPR